MTLPWFEPSTMLITKLGRLRNAMERAFHCVRSHWIRGFIAFHWVRLARIVMLMVPV